MWWWGSFSRVIPPATRAPSRERSLRGGKAPSAAPTGECVEVAPAADGGVMVRDSKNPGGAVLAFTTGEWRAFLAGVRNAEFDL
ncbi:DUF397 domain-containing protein [Nonomuraea dietziae]|uniref:DUF397 domain-containing protein n=1 Tax=Nonomuraea dietziae TaxID=65515 RepID=UPI003CD0B780